MQLYTSKSYEDRRSMLVSPEKDEESDEQNNKVANNKVAIQKHVLSPQLVNAISSTAQVLWANSEQTGGLLGKSDVQLQTAVGMPVAVDGNGNMCVVVMFSPNHIRNTDDAMEYLQFISRSATSSSIPCLLPVFSNDDMRAVIPANNGQQTFLSASLGDGVTASFVNLEGIHNRSDLLHAQKDSFGIPMLPGMEPDISGDTDAFDDASYGVWNTIMDTAPNSVVSIEKSSFPPLVRERMEEFLTAFLSMSVFDAADIWIPREAGLCHEVTVLANDSLQDFRDASDGIFIGNWSGAVGRAYASGNPVWSHVPDIIFDRERRHVSEKAGIKTALAVPVAKCVLCFYSLVRTDAVPFVLKFLQQALRLLWVGLDNVEKPQVGQEIWKEVGPTDLGEMAADLEMHHEFLRKKRPHSSMDGDEIRDRSESLSIQFDTLARASSENVPLSSNSHFSIEPYHEVATTTEPTNQALVHPPQQSAIIDDVQNHLRDALRAVGNAVPWTPTNIEGTKRAHIMTREEVSENRTNPVSETYNFPAPDAPLSEQQGSTSQESQFAYVGQQPSAETTPAQLSNYCGFVAAPSYDFSQSNGSGQYQPVYQTMQSNPPSNANQGSYQTYDQQHVQSYSVPSQIHSLVPQPGSALPQPAPLQMPQQLPNRIIQAPASGTIAHVNHVPSPQLQPYHQIGASGYNQYQQPSGVVMSQHSYQTQTVLPPVPIQSAPMTAAPLATSAEPVMTMYYPTADELPPAPTSSGGGKACRIQGCCDPAVSRRPYCVTHSGNRLCEHSGCSKCAQGSTRFCIAHGGGRRCTFLGCDKGARDKYFCAAHGGGKRCATDGCSKSAVGGSSLCTGHGGGRRCSIDGCDKSAQSSTKFCVKHGGGKTCIHGGCPKVARGRTPYCAAHGGGIRCKLEGCNRVAIGKLQLCRAHGGGARTKSSPIGMNNNDALTGKI